MRRARSPAAGLGARPAGKPDESHAIVAGGVTGHRKRPKGTAMLVIWIAIGVFIGLVAAAAIGVSLMRSKMVVPERSAHSFDETCARVEQVVDDTAGWSFPRPSFDMSVKLAEKGALPANLRRIRLYSVCSPPVAAPIPIFQNHADCPVM